MTPHHEFVIEETLSAGAFADRLTREIVSRELAQTRMSTAERARTDYRNRRRRIAHFGARVFAEPC